MRYGIVVFFVQVGDRVGDVPVMRSMSIDAGRAIRFEGRCDATRAQGDPADGKVPVYCCDGDAVSVACAQATPSVGRYVLTSPDEFSVSNSCQLGFAAVEGLHDFYAFSPAGCSRILKYRETVSKASLPSVQECPRRPPRSGAAPSGFCRRGNLALRLRS